MAHDRPRPKISADQAWFATVKIRGGHWLVP